MAQLTIREIDLKVQRDRRLTRVVLLLPFAGTEGAIGLLSHLTGVFRIPEAGQWFPLGFWVNTAILAAGVVTSLAVWRRGYRMSDEALLKLAEVRAKAEVERLRKLSKSVGEEVAAIQSAAEPGDAGHDGPGAAP